MDSGGLRQRLLELAKSNIIVYTVKDDKRGVLRVRLDEDLPWGITVIIGRASLKNGIEDQQYIYLEEDFVTYYEDILEVLNETEDKI